MLLRKTSEVYIYTLLVFTGLEMAFVFVSIILQINMGYTGINSLNKIQVTCSGQYQLSKYKDLSLIDRHLEISFISCCASGLLTMVILALVIELFCCLCLSQQQGINPVEKGIKSIKSKFLYILSSFSGLCSLIAFGKFLGFYLEIIRKCELNDLKLQILLIVSINGIKLILMVLCWCIIGCMNRQINKYETNYLKKQNKIEIVLPNRQNDEIKPNDIQLIENNTTQQLFNQTLPEEPKKQLINQSFTKNNPILPKKNLKLFKIQEAISDETSKLQHKSSLNPSPHNHTSILKQLQYNQKDNINQSPRKYFPYQSSQNAINQQNLNLHQRILPQNRRIQQIDSDSQKKIHQTYIKGSQTINIQALNSNKKRKGMILEYIKGKYVD